MLKSITPLRYSMSTSIYLGEWIEFCHCKQKGMLDEIISLAAAAIILLEVNKEKLLIEVAFKGRKE